MLWTVIWFGKYSKNHIYNFLFYQSDDLDDKYVRLCDFLMTCRTKIKFDEEKPISKPEIK